jgi:hypothetical protein
VWLNTAVKAYDGVTVETNRACKPV